MPTIQDLTAAAAAADDDLLPVEQAGVTRRVTRSQLVAGLQPALALGAGALLGRTTAGIGGPESIVVGDNLLLRNGVLAGAPGFRVSGLPQVPSVSMVDSLAVSQGGADSRVSVGAVLASVASLAGLDVSALAATGHGGISRSLSDWVTDGAMVEAFGAVGDGVTDDTAAVDRAVASGRPVRFGPKTYIVNGQWTVSRPAVLLGIEGQTILKRLRQAGGAWINITAACFEARGVTFDAGSLAGESWGVLVTDACKGSIFDGCTFQGATGPTLGCGLTIAARDGISGAGSSHVVTGCVAQGNSAHGIWVQAAAGAVIEGCRAYDNGQYGFCMDFNDPEFLQQVRHGRVSGCEAWGNRRGISIGNYNETNLEPPRWGNANPDAVGVVVEGNRCHDNSDYGVAVSGSGLQVLGNLLEANGSGVLANCAASVIGGNVMAGPGQYGVDAGGSLDGAIVGNLVRGFNVGINPGGSRDMTIADNRLGENVWAITVYNQETDGSGVPFGIACTGMTIQGNRIVLKDGSGGGILLLDGPQNVVVADNSVSGGNECSPSQGLWALTDQIVVRGNRWNEQARLICNPVVLNGVGQVQVPDLLDEAMVTVADNPVGSIVGQHQAAVSGQVTFVRVTSGGSGYTLATAAITGGGSGASAKALVRDGAVIGIALQNSGEGYATGSTVVSLTGDGTGASAEATVGLPIADGRRVRLHCNGPVRFTRVGSDPFQDNWTGGDILVPRCSTVEWVGTWGNWQAVAFPLGDYLAPPGDGSLVVRSVAGDVVVRPSGSGQFRVSSDTESLGFSSSLGRGSPEGIVTASMGSDYRNLDGGSGTTLWLKRSGSGSTGWAAIG